MLEEKARDSSRRIHPEGEIDAPSGSDKYQRG